MIPDSGLQQLRVLFLTPYYKPYLGGIERAVERLAKGLILRHDVMGVGVLTTHYAFPRQHMEGLSAYEVMDPGIEVFRVKGVPRIAPPYFSVPLVWFSPRAFRDVLSRFCPDVLHWVGDGWFWGHLWSAIHRKRNMAIVFSPSFHKLSPDKQWLRPINIVACRAAERITSLSRLEANSVRHTYLVPAEKQVILPWGVDQPSSLVSPVSDGDKRLTVLCVGRLGSHKNQAFLIDVWAMARNQFVSPARLVLIGRDEGGGGGEAAVRNAIRGHGLENDVLLTGEVTDKQLQAWFARADVFALFSRYEAFGLVFFEAMAWGVPVLTHRVGTNAELLRRGAILTNAYDSAEATEKLARLVNDENFRLRIGRDAKTYASAFTWDSVIEKFMTLYQRILLERRSKTSSGVAR